MISKSRFWVKAVNISNLLAKHQQYTWRFSGYFRVLLLLLLSIFFCQILLYSNRYQYSHVSREIVFLSFCQRQVLQTIRFLSSANFSLAVLSDTVVFLSKYLSVCAKVHMLRCLSELIIGIFEYLKTLNLISHKFFRSLNAFYILLANHFKIFRMAYLPNLDLLFLNIKN